MLKLKIFIILFCAVSCTVVGQTDDPKQFVKDWVQAHPEVKLIPQVMYDRYNDGERTEINALQTKIVYQAYLTKEDILLYEKSITTLPVEQILDKQ
jgi:hypothetical protein